MNITEVSISTGRKKPLKLKIGERLIEIPLDEVVFAYFHEQFLRDNPTPQQKRRFATLMNLVREAYLKDVDDGKASAAS